jgi:hypothetical protein
MELEIITMIPKPLDMYIVLAIELFQGCFKLIKNTEIPEKMNNNPVIGDILAIGISPRYPRFGINVSSKLRSSPVKYPTTSSILKIETITVNIVKKDRIVEDEYLPKENITPPSIMKLTDVVGAIGI